MTRNGIEIGIVTIAKAIADDEFLYFKEYTSHFQYKLLSFSFLRVGKITSVRLWFRLANFFGGAFFRRVCHSVTSSRGDNSTFLLCHFPMQIQKL